jgi:hypothetical protein
MFSSAAMHFQGIGSFILAADFLLSTWAAVQPTPLQELTKLIQARTVPLNALVDREQELTQFLQAQPATPELLDRERELTKLLQARLETYGEAKGTVHNVRFSLGNGSAAQDLNVPAETISNQYWLNATKILGEAGKSTPIPSALLLNAPPLPAQPTQWQSVMDNPSQPLDTKMGSALMYAMTGPVTPTPPPSQQKTEAEFMEVCPLVLFQKEVSIRAPSCGSKLGSWNLPHSTRHILRWDPTFSGMKFAIDSAVEGRGKALFADLSTRLTLKDNVFSMTNCLGVERWKIEEHVVKYDNMGSMISSSMDIHDITQNGNAYFLQYVIRKASTGQIAAQTSVFHLKQRQVNWTSFENEYSVGQVAATVEKDGMWEGGGWEECMDRSSPRGWNIFFPQNISKVENLGTVQDLRIAMTAAVTLMAHRDQSRDSYGIDRKQDEQEMYIVATVLILVLLMGCLLANFCMVFKYSGIREKLRVVSFDLQTALLPKKPFYHHDKHKLEQPLYNTV